MWNVFVRALDDFADSVTVGVSIPDTSPRPDEGGSLVTEAKQRLVVGVRTAGRRAPNRGRGTHRVEAMVTWFDRVSFSDWLLNSLI